MTMTGVLSGLKPGKLELDPASAGQRRDECEAHVFDPSDVAAIDAALAAERPLLVRGEPGVGKTQLARAAAVGMRRAYCQMVVDSRTEVRDLRWTEDLVSRLADAQLVSSMGTGKTAADLRARIGNIANYVEPGPLWWAFDWHGAARHAATTACVEDPTSLHPPQPSPVCTPDNGCVVLIDEIDKADPDLPNGLLEALGSGSFMPRGKTSPVEAVRWPLIVITTNEDRALPDAFVRRCVVHEIRLPEQEARFKEHLAARGSAHFPDAPPDVLGKAAHLTWADRIKAQERHLTPLPGQAEFLDLVRAVLHGAGDGGKGPLEALETLAPFFLRKHKELRG